jgi:hypothetical protein
MARVFGEPIYFSATIPETVRNLNGAVSFVKFLLSSNGERILKTQGLNYLKPVVEGDIEKENKLTCHLNRCIASEYTKSQTHQDYLMGFYEEFLPLINENAQSQS